jgi:predicted pyridoxine 5'-phosphate oxidase superfamily flavin-nucleotide-binding protein
MDVGDVARARLVLGRIGHPALNQLTTRPVKHRRTLGPMEGAPLYHDGARQLQERYDSRRIADRLEQVTVHDTFSDGDRRFVESASMFFLATADPDGFPDCSYKGGRPGFVRVVDERTLAFPSYDGNGMFRSLGNVVVNPRVAMLFIDFAHPSRMRVHGTASLHEDDTARSMFDGAQLVVRVRAERIFPNCPRYIHRMELVEHSVYAPAPGHVPPEPEWKRMDVFRDHLPHPDGAPS